MSDTQTTTDNAFTLIRKENGVAHLVMDVPGETMNTLKAEFGEQITEVFKEVREDDSIKAVVVTSGKRLFCRRRRYQHVGKLYNS